MHVTKLDGLPCGSPILQMVSCFPRPNANDKMLLPMDCPLMIRRAVPASYVMEGFCRCIKEQYFTSVPLAPLNVQEVPPRLSILSLNEQIPEFDDSSSDCTSSVIQLPRGDVSPEPANIDADHSQDDPDSVEASGTSTEHPHGDASPAPAGSTLTEHPRDGACRRDAASSTGDVPVAQSFPADADVPSRSDPGRCQTSICTDAAEVISGSVHRSESVRRFMTHADRQHKRESLLLFDPESRPVEFHNHFYSHSWRGGRLRTGRRVCSISVEWRFASLWNPSLDR